MKKVLTILGIIFGVLLIIGLSIWVGFPSPQGFDRTAICIVGYLFGIGLLFIGIGFSADLL